MSDSFLFSVQKLNLELEPFALRGGGRGGARWRLMRKRLDWRVPPTENTRLQAEAAFQMPSSLHDADNEECWAGHVLSPPVSWAGINMSVLLKVRKGSFILLSTVILSIYMPSAAPKAFSFLHVFSTIYLWGLRMAFQTGARYLSLWFWFARL